MVTIYMRGEIEFESIIFFLKGIVHFLGAVEKKITMQWKKNYPTDQNSQAFPTIP
jgi:hypothetical protein